MDYEVSSYNFTTSEFRNIPKILYGKIGDKKIYLVDGLYVRNRIHIDFLAGHHAIDEFIPENEIWIDWYIPREEIGHYIYHEIIEWMLMEKYKFSYDRAHKMISELEKNIRRKENERQDNMGCERS